MGYSVLTDPKKYIESFLKIKTKEGKIVPFKLNESQEKLYRAIMEQVEEGKPVRIIILKARQMGFSTLTEGLIFHDTATHFLHNAMIITHKDEATTNLFNMSKLFFERLPERMRPMMKASNAKELIFENPTKDPKKKEKRPGLRSKIKCTTAGGKGVGRSDTLTTLHASEVAFWPGDILDTLAGILQAVPSLPGTMVIYESTANGFNAFKQLWDDAVSGKTDFVPLFFPWFEMQTYRKPYHGEELTAEEKDILERFQLDHEQIMWRRWQIANNCNNDIKKFKQEYPSTPEEAFIATGESVFDTEAISKRLYYLLENSPVVKRGCFTYEKTVKDSQAGPFILLKNREFVEKDNGEIEIYKEPEDGVPYVIGGDTAGDGSDRFTLHVLDNRTGEQVARLMRTYDEDEYTEQAYCLGMYYNTALIAIEANFSTHPNKVLEWLRYPRIYEREVPDNYTGAMQKTYGFRTTTVTRPLIVAGLVTYFRDFLHYIHDVETLREALTFIRNEKGKAEAEQGAHDDLLMGLGIALQSRTQHKMEAERAPKKKVKWTADMWEDYRNADAKTKAYLRERWGEPTR